MIKQETLFPIVPARGLIVPQRSESGVAVPVPQQTGPGTAPRTFEDFYATFDIDSICSYIPSDVAVLVPASSAARRDFKNPGLPAHITKRGADSGGFVASRVWGDYRYRLSTYVTWLMKWQPQWAATMDYCCEPELDVVTRDRQERTRLNAWEAWLTYKHLPFAWVPTIQGWLPEDYRRHAYEMKPLIDEMSLYYAHNPAWRVGIGTLCRRDDVVMVQAILNAVREVLPDVPLHLWGIKLDALRSVNLAQVISTDSAVWHGAMYARDEIARAAAAKGMSMREYRVKVNLPAYIAKVRAAVAESAQMIDAQSNTEVLNKVRSILRTHGGWTLDLRPQRNRVYAYAVRRNYTRRDRVYISPVSELATTLESLPALLVVEPPQQIPDPLRCGTVRPRAGTLWNIEDENEVQA